MSDVSRNAVLTAAWCRSISVRLPSRPLCLVPLRYLLDRPFVAIGIAEVHEPSPGQVLDPTDVNAAPGEFLMRLLDVRHHHLQPLERSGLHFRQPGAKTDGAGGARRRQLHKAQTLIYLLIVISVEANLLRVEALRPVDVRHGYGYEFQFPVHALPPPYGSAEHCSGQWDFASASARPGCW